MAKKRNLSDLIAEETQQTSLSANQSVSALGSEPVTTEVSDSKSTKLANVQTNEVPNSETNKVTELQTTKVADSESTAVPKPQTNVLSDSRTDEVPKYLTLVRKEARLREDQLDDLTSLARSLNRKRQGSGERITENTLIRVAVDLLMNQSNELKGTTEQELSASVGLD